MFKRWPNGRIFDLPMMNKWNPQCGSSFSIEVQWMNWFSKTLNWLKYNTIRQPNSSAENERDDEWQIWVDNGFNLSGFLLTTVLQVSHSQYYTVQDIKFLRELSQAKAKKFGFVWWATTELIRRLASNGKFIEFLWKSFRMTLPVKKFLNEKIFRAGCRHGGSSSLEVPHEDLQSLKFRLKDEVQTKSSGWSSG